MKLFEILRNSTVTYPYHQIPNSNGRYMASYEFYAGDKQAVVRFAIIPSWSHPVYMKYLTNALGVESLTTMDREELSHAMEKLGGSYVVDFMVDESFDITGTGNAIPIFATVIKIIKEFITKHKTLEIVFTADENSRIKFYNRLSMDLTSGTNFVRVGHALGIYNLINKQLLADHSHA